MKRILIGLAALFMSAAVHAQNPDILEVITIEGVIRDHTATQVAAMVEKINDNTKIKAVLVQIDTPGGGAIASAVVYEELSKIKVPVVAWCMNLCASGGMYAAMAPSIKYVGVRTETISGSVGVIMNLTRYNRLLEWAKIDSETYKSGKLKDSFNPTRPVNEDDQKYLQAMITSLADRFYAVVDKGRGKKISAESWEQIKSARVFIGDEAVRIGLVDGVHTKSEILKKAKDLSGSKNIYTREELTKMSRAANDTSSHYNTTRPPLGEQSQFGDLPFLIELLKEIRAGENVKFEYRMPYTF